MLKEYSLGLMFDKDKRVPLIRKLRPAWQAHFLNGVGGKQEVGETPHQCMIREFAEETGYVHMNWDHFCSLRGENSYVHCFRTFVDKLPWFPKTNDTGEAIEVWEASNVKHFGSPVPNLPLLLELATFNDFRIETGTGLRAA